MVAVGIAYLLVLRSGDSIYRAQREDREAASVERSGSRPLD